VDDLTELYNNEITKILNCQLPTRTFKRHPQPSDPWFDTERRSAKRSTQRLERATADAAKSQDKMALAAATKAWRTQRRSYRSLRNQKHEEFWTRTVIDNSSSPRDLGGQSIHCLDEVGSTPVMTPALTSSTSSSLIK
jgi:hypothetical protein